MTWSLLFTQYGQACTVKEHIILYRSFQWQTKPQEQTTWRHWTYSEETLVLCTLDSVHPWLWMGWFRLFAERTSSTWSDVMPFSHWPPGFPNIKVCSRCQRPNKERSLTLTPLTWRIWWAPSKASKWQMGFNSAFKGLSCPLWRIMNK